MKNYGHKDSKEADEAGDKSVVRHGGRSGGQERDDGFRTLIVLVRVEVAVHPDAVADDPYQLE